MAVKAPSREFSIFIRKIGYSVGLEHTLQRLTDFARLYASQETLSFADISRLLHSEKPTGWGLDRKNEHILDVLRSLRVIDVRRGEVAVLEVGDALGILRRMQSDDDVFLQSARFLFAHSLVVADGDIFLNALAARFDPDEFAQRIVRMIEYKWSVLERYFTSAHQRAAIYDVVNVEVQETNPGSRGKGGVGQLPDPMRLRSKRGSLSPIVTRPNPKISAPYLAKSLPRRRAWATSIGLATEDGALTAMGDRFIASISDAGFCGPSCMATWPLAHELQNPAFAAIRSGDLPVFKSWDLLLLVGRALGVLSDRLHRGNEDALAALEQVIATYRSLNASKSIVRTEVPVRVAYMCGLALSIGQESIVNYPMLIETEQQAASPRIVARPSRLAELALSI